MKLECSGNALHGAASDLLGASAIDTQAEVRRCVLVRRNDLMWRMLRFAQQQCSRLDAARNATEEFAGAQSRDACSHTRI
jgi:hypothetical protein